MSPSAVARWLEGLAGPPPYLAVFAVAFAEHALFVGTFVPGEVILPPHRGGRHHRGTSSGDRSWSAAATCSASRRPGWGAPGAGPVFALTGAVLALAFLRLRSIGPTWPRAAADPGEGSSGQ